MEEMSTPVWRLHGLTGSEPGWMEIENGVVTLMLETGTEAAEKMFEVPLSSIGDVKFPRPQMSGGCNFVVDGEKYRLSFLQPQNTRAPTPYSAAKGLGSISHGRKTGKAWKAILP